MPGTGCPGHILWVLGTRQAASKRKDMWLVTSMKQGRTSQAGTDLKLTDHKLQVALSCPLGTCLRKAHDIPGTQKDGKEPTTRRPVQQGQDEWTDHCASVQHAGADRGIQSSTVKGQEDSRMKRCRKWGRADGPETRDTREPKAWLPLSRLNLTVMEGKRPREK